MVNQGSSKKAAAWATGLSMLFCVVLVMSGVVRSATAAEPPATAQEQQAIDAVKGFLGSWPSRNVDMAMSFMSDDVETRMMGGGPGDKHLMGAAALRAELDDFFNGPLGKNTDFAKTLTNIYVVSGPGGSTVLTRRSEMSSVGGGEPHELVIASAWWVNKDGKITAWNDYMLSIMPDFPLTGTDGRPAP